MSESDVPSGCAPYDEDLSAWLDGELDASGAAVVRNHVEGCARCTARVEELRAVDQRLRAIAAAAPSAPESERLARLRARLAAERAQLQPLPSRATAPAPQADAVPEEPAASAAPRAAARVAPPRRRRLPAALVAAAAAVLLAALALPRLFEDTLAPAGVELAERDASSPATAPAAPAPAPAPRDAAPLATFAARPLSPAPGRLGASADEGAPTQIAAQESRQVPGAGAGQAEALRARVPGPAAGSLRADDEDLELALALDELEGVAPEDLPLVEHLDALERMAEAGDGGSG